MSSVVSTFGFCLTRPFFWQGWVLQTLSVKNPVNLIEAPKEHLIKYHYVCELPSHSSAVMVDVTAIGE